MGHQKGKIEHSGAKKTQGAFHGKKKDAQNDIQYAEKIQLSPEDLDMRNSKIRITGLIQLNLYEKLHNEADDKEINYIELLTEILDDYFK